MLNVSLTTNQTEQITAETALTGVIVDGDHATIDATGKQVLHQALVAFHRELWEQGAPAVRGTLA